MILKVYAAPVWFDLTSHEECGAFGNNPTDEHHAKCENVGDHLNLHHSEPITLKVHSHLEDLDSGAQPLVHRLTAGVGLRGKRSENVPTLRFHVTPLAASFFCQYSYQTSNLSGDFRRS